jgi:hypothetical protein
MDLEALEFSRLNWSNYSSTHEEEHQPVRIAGFCSQSEQNVFFLLKKPMACCSSLIRHDT